MGRGIPYGALSTGGTAYFAARSDLSTLIEDLAPVHPTQLNFSWCPGSGTCSTREYLGESTAPTAPPPM